ncbi:MAG: hypothetical protein KGD65_12455 [Candidatus Lokiarchaeota archaeon]|nr:hypothetical protein [Candidatus Lokiarchaeota archaeon]
MPLNIDLTVLNQLSQGMLVNQIQNIFDKFLFDLIDYLELEPSYKKIQITLSEISVKEPKPYILDSYVKKTVQDDSLLIELSKNYKFLPFILLREAYYCFIPKEIEDSEIIKICINQILENDLIKLDYHNEWKQLIRNTLVDRDFLLSQFDRLQNFFNIEATEPFDNPVQFFFKDIRENATLIGNRNVEYFYDILFERYSYKTSKSLFSEEIVEVLRIIMILFYEYKRYLSLTDYQTLLKEHLKNKKIKTNLSLKKFIENLQWINKCTSIAPSYNRDYNTLNILPINCSLMFNPLIEKHKIKKILTNFPFYSSPKISENGFITEVSMIFHLPKIYLNDFVKFIQKIESNGFIVNKQIYVMINNTNFLNLNYFLQFASTKGIIDPNIRTYKEKYELEHCIEYPIVSKLKKFSMFEVILLDRIRNVSVTGLTFDKRIETLNAIKDDVRNQKRRQENIIIDFKNMINKVVNYRNEFLRFLTNNQDQGFYYIFDRLNSIIIYLDLIERVFRNNSLIKNEYQLKQCLKDNYSVKNIEENIIINDKNLQEWIFQDLIPIYFKSRTLYKEEIEKLKLYYSVLDSCYNLKIINPKSIMNLVKNPELVKEVHETKEKNLKFIFKSEKLSKITNQKIESTLEELLKSNPPIIKPMLVNTIFTSTFAKYYPILILKYSPETLKKLAKLRTYFPRLIMSDIEDLITEEKLIFVLIYIVNIKEKGQFLSILHMYFKDELVSYRRYYWRGIERISKLLEFKDFYDFENHQFFYTRDLFDQLFIFTKQILGNKIFTSYNKNIPLFESKIFWSTSLNMDALVKLIKLRLSFQNINFKLSILNDFMSFRGNLKSYLLTQVKFLSIKSAEFFNQYVKSIKFLPAFRKFGMAQYHLYFRPHDNVDLKLILTNSFQKVEYRASIEENQAIYIKYLFPYKKPNKTYLNWLIKSKKAVKESCLFYKKKVFTVIHFDHSLSSNGWNYSSNRFKIHVQNVLFNPNYRQENPNLREFNLEEYPEDIIFGPSSLEFNMLSQVYNWQAYDIKSYLGSKKHSIIDNITKLIEKNLIFPYISLKNLDFQDKISLILPNIKVELNKKIIEIFSFFNFCRIYEIEGELFIYGLEEIETFENGFLIEIWFPKCEMDEYLDVFDLLTQYLGIKYYLILSDLVNGKTLLKSIFGNANFLKTYNPLINFKWNGKDKIWMNHKLFNEKFESIYPDLFFGFKKDNNNKDQKSLQKSFEKPETP